MADGQCDHGICTQRLASALYGPERDGWCIPTGDDHGATTYASIDYCPWCGVRLGGEMEAMAEALTIHPPV